VVGLLAIGHSILLFLHWINPITINLFEGCDLNNPFSSEVTQNPRKTQWLDYQYT
jgi:hypothetical protein